LRVGWHFCAPRDPQAKGCVERLQDFLERSFEPGRCFANELDFQLQLDAWFDERANPRMHKTLRARPIDRLIEERWLMAPLPAIAPDVDRRWALRVVPDPYLRLTAAITRSTRAWSTAASKPRSPTARSSRSRWIPASRPAGTRARSPSTARSPRSNTPARSRPSATSAKASPSRRLRFVRWPSMTS
jgi:hypothetical protein